MYASEFHFQPQTAVSARMAVPFAGTGLTLWFTP